MPNPFVKDGYIAPEASLNKLRLAGEYNGVPLPGRIRGKTALDIVSGAVFSAEADTLFARLGIRAGGADKMRRFEKMLGGGRGAEEAGALLRELGENLGYVLLALKNGGGEGAAQARPEWSAEHWAYWNSIGRVYLSGGLSYGIIGQRLLQACNKLLGRAGRPYEVGLAENGEYLPLIGAYQWGAEEAVRLGLEERIAVLDFGHTFVKRGFADGGGLTVFDRVGSIARHMDGEPEDAGLMNDFLIGVILDTCKEAPRPPSVAAVSIANYISGGNIYPHRGEYGRLARIAAPGGYECLLSRELGGRLGRPLRVILMHDGTAAAYGPDCAPGEKSAVITLGTGLGVGFCDMRTWPYKKIAIKKEMRV